MEINHSNIEKLISNFGENINKFYSRNNGFPESALYFHKKTMEERRKGSIKQLLDSKEFSDRLYSTLVSWGMDRMDGGARLVKFEDFYANLKNNSELLQKFEGLSLDAVGNTGMINKSGVSEEDILRLFRGINVMGGKLRLVGVSKTLHHLLPELFMPIDRKYTLNFFYGREFYTEKDQENKFIEIFWRVRYIYDNLVFRKIKFDRFNGEWDTSVTKIVDNAIIGFMS